MAYRRPAIEVIQEFQSAAAALALPSLPALIVGPGYQVVDDVDAGVYDEANLAITSYSYTGLTIGAVVDLADAPTLEAEANAHKSVGVKLSDAYLKKVPASPAVSLITGVLADPNLFTDATSGAFSGFDPDADGAPRFYVDIIDAIGIDAADKGRKLVIGKTDDNTLVIAAEWKSTLPLTNIEYRVLEFRGEEIYPEAEFGNNGITKTATSVDILPGLESTTDATPMVVVEATVLLSWRAIRPDLAGTITAFTDQSSIDAVFGIGATIPSNTAAYAINLALLNTTTEVSYVGLGADFFTAEETSFQTALDFLESKDVYGLAVLTHNTAIHQAAKSHVEGMSLSSVGRERVCFFNRRIQEIEVIVPPSGLGTATSAGTGNGLSGTNNLVFKDPTNGAFITDSIGVGQLLEITSYTAVEGVQRSVTPDERDFFSITGTNHLRIGNAAFVAGDVGKSILVKAATSLANDIVFSISAIIDSVKATVGTAPTAELMAAATRTWIADINRAVTHNAADAVVQATKQWTFVNGAFTAADVGRKLFMANAADAASNGVFTIGSVLSTTTITTVEATGADETFGGTVTQDIYDVDREPARDAVSDSVDSSNRQWTILGAIFTSEDIGRKLRLAGTAGGTNDGDFVIEAIISPTICRTTQTPGATEEFNGFSTTTLTVLDIVSVAPNATEAAFITGTRHAIASIISESQFTLGSDPGAGFGGTLEDVVYRVTKDMSLNEQATFIAGYASSFASRRAVHTWPDILAASVNSLATKIPGYFAGAVLAGLTAGLPSQTGFTNLAVTGFVGRENSNDKFSDTQLDTIAGGGNMIFIQEIAGAALIVRHQLTTDLSTIHFQEFSVTKNVDLLARFFRGHYKPFIGVYNITDGLMDLLKTRGTSGIDFLKAQRAARVGAPLRSGQLSRIEESSIQPDSIEIDIDVNVPLPLNNIKLTLLV